MDTSTCRESTDTACRRYRLNIWDVGGQKTIRSYWRNYYESTDGLIWVVDSADTARLRDCAEVRRLFGQIHGTLGMHLIAR